MASFLRQLVAGPRLPHPEAGLDLCYVTDNIIATSGPSSTYPQRAYRNPTDALVRFLDSKHGDNWAIWEFRAEGTGYPDDEVYGRIHHFPWPDHHPPPFALIPSIMASMRNWLHGSNDAGQEGKGKRVAVVHCKAGKGRSGTVACSYLVSQEGWKLEDATQRFTERRMRSGFGAGVSIPSQMRWLRYVDLWTNRYGKKYVERPIEILEIHVWGLRDGVKIAVEGFVDEGKKIKCFHLFHRNEKTVVDDGKIIPPEKNGKKDRLKELASSSTVSSSSSSFATTASPVETVTSPTASNGGTPTAPTTRVSAVVLRPNKPVILPSSDVNIDFERRSKAAYTGWTMVTSVAHVWFNAYFEGGDQHDSGIFEEDWEKLDGIKGSSKKGTRALDRVRVVWRYASPSQLANKAPERPEDAQPAPGKVITEPKPGDPVPEVHAADWRGQTAIDPQDPAGLSSRDGEGEPTRQSSKKHKDKEHEAKRESKGLTASSHPVITGASTAAAVAVSETTKGVRKGLGLRKQTDTSEDVSLANSSEDLSLESGKEDKTEGKIAQKQKRKTPIGTIKDENEQGAEETDTDIEAVRPYFENNGNGNGNSTAAEKEVENASDAKEKEDKQEHS
ncbi:Telomerase protein component 1 [Paecilomyces lecythidis]